MTPNSCNHLLLSIIQSFSYTSIYTFLIHNRMTYNAHNKFPSSTESGVNDIKLTTLSIKVNISQPFDQKSTLVTITFESNIYYTLSYGIYTSRFHLRLLAFLIFLCYLWFKASYTLLIHTSNLLFTSSYRILVLTLVHNTHTIFSLVYLSTP